MSSIGNRNVPDYPVRVVGAVGEDVSVAQFTGFSAPTRTWFEAAFAAPTPGQVGAWEAISAGRPALVVALPGSGKPRAASLWSIDRLASEDPPAARSRRCRVLYVSPLKA